MKKSKLPVTPVGHRLLIKMNELDGDKKSHKKGKIYLSHSTDDYERERQFGTRGTVVAMGESCYNLGHHGEPWVKVGDAVIIKEYEGIHYMDEDSDSLYRFVNDEAIIGVIH